MSQELAARLKWNAESDEFNQWDSLGQDEKNELIEEATTNLTAKERTTK